MQQEQVGNCDLLSHYQPQQMQHISIQQQQQLQQQSNGNNSQNEYSSYQYMTM